MEVSVLFSFFCWPDVDRKDPTIRLSHSPTPLTISLAARIEERNTQNRISQIQHDVSSPCHNDCHFGHGWSHQWSRIQRQRGKMRRPTDFLCQNLKVLTRISAAYRKGTTWWWWWATTTEKEITRAKARWASDQTSTSILGIPEKIQTSLFFCLFTLKILHSSQFWRFSLDLLSARATEKVLLPATFANMLGMVSLVSFLKMRMVMATTKQARLSLKEPWFRMV